MGGVLLGLTLMAVVAVSLILAFSLAISAVLFHHRKGRFTVIRHRGEVYAFSTDFGVFRPNAAAGTLQVSGKDGRRLEVPFDRLRELRLESLEEPAFLAELALGFDLTDLLRRYRDGWEWSTIILGLEGGPPLPVFVVGQYQRREFMMEWWYRLQRDILARLGLYREAGAYAREIHATLRDILCRAGAQLPLGGLGKSRPTG